MTEENGSFEWVPEKVRDRLMEAGELQAALNREPDGSGLPPDAVLKRAEQTIGWLSWLGTADAELVWARAKQTRWKAICWRLGLSRPTAHRRWQRSLRTIASRLNSNAPLDSR